MSVSCGFENARNAHLHYRRAVVMPVYVQIAFIILYITDWGKKISLEHSNLSLKLLSGFTAI